jgi:hypothetical protein
MHRIAFLFVVAILYSSVYADNNWPRFRGPTAMGVAEDDPRLPDQWSRAENVVWQWAYNGKLFFLSEDGMTYVVEAGPEFKQLHTNSLDELCLASPAAYQGMLLIRTASRLYCFSNSISGMDKEKR